MNRLLMVFVLVVLTTFGTIATEYRRKLAAMEMIKSQPEVVLNEDDYLFTGKTSVWYRFVISTPLNRA